MDSHVERGDKHQSTPRYRRSTSIASCCFLLLSPPPAALFRLGPSQAFYFYSLLLLFPSAPPSPAALFRLGTLPDFYLYSSSVTFSIRWGPLEVNNLYIYIYIYIFIYTPYIYIYMYMYMYMFIVISFHSVKLRMAHETIYRYFGGQSIHG